ncbi:MAG: carboxymuconolactone decarboxylase family protein [Acidimicrobiia bacterium]
MPMMPVDTDNALVRSLFDKSMSTNGRIGNLYRVMGNAPDMLDAWIGFAWRLRADCKSPRELRELLIMRVAQLTQATYEWQQHWTMALACGVSEEKLLALAEWSTSSLFTDVERTCLKMADEMTSGLAVSDDTYAAMSTLFDNEQVIELALTVAFYNCVSRVLMALGVPLEDRPFKPGW